MIVVDRFTGKQIDVKDLPNRIDSGRFYFFDNNILHNITSNNIELNDNQFFITNILDDGNRMMCSVLREIGLSLKDNLLTTFPIIQNPTKEAKPTDFEKELDSQLSHFEYIFQDPHALLDRITEKVYVSKVKRIPPKGYQHLASHTEDWLHKSITTLRPRKILHEELVLSYNVFENQILCSFVKRALGKIRNRIRFLNLQEKFLEQCDKIFVDTANKRGWQEKNNRNWTLIGRVYKQNADNSKIRKRNLKTLDLLNRINYVLGGLRSTQMYADVDQRIAQSIRWHDTNVLIEHKHYKHIKPLWNQLEKDDSYNTLDKLRNEDEENILGLQSYAESLFIYVITNAFANRELNIPSYELIGNVLNWKAIHPFLPDIIFSKDEDGVMFIKIGSRPTKRIVALGNIPYLDDSLYDTLNNNDDLVILCYDVDNEKKIESEKLITVNPMDVDSVERIGKFIRSEMLRDFLHNIDVCIKFNVVIRDYIKYISAPFLRINVETNSISFSEYPYSIDKQSIILSLKNDESFKKEKKKRQNEIIQLFSNVLSSIERTIDDFKTRLCVCPRCGTKLNRHMFVSNSYICCSRCGMSLIQKKEGYFEFKAQDSIIDNNSLGMDYVKFYPNSEERGPTRL